MKKKNRFFALKLILCMTFLSIIGMGTFFYSSIKSESLSKIEDIIYPKSSIVVDEHDNVIENLSPSKLDNIQFDNIPKLLIDALLCIEDREFYYHNGINEKRIITSLLNNMFSNTIQGGSTITQQLVKNTMLSSQKTFERKIKEAYLSNLLENKLSKQEILEYYFNHTYFDQSFPGIVYAARHFFSKEVQSLNLNEIATLVGLCKSPSYYHPINNPSSCTSRKNTVLKAMLDNKVITNEEYNLAIKIDVSSFLNIPITDEYYKNQAYLDFVYLEAHDLIGIDPYTTPVKIETYIDTSLQNYIDEIENNKTYDEYIQFGGVVVDNDKAKVVGVIGGKNYMGKKIFSRAYSLKASPASTIKPVFSYALGVENYNMHSLTTFNDIETNYPGTNITIHNADKKYLGKISMIEALGYSRNTTAVSLLNQLSIDYSNNYLINYLKNIDLYDNGVFSLSYALGGFSYGISPYQLSGAYTMLANDGLYLKPSAIKRIISLETNQELYNRDTSFKKILSPSTASIITSTLERVIDENYYGIKEAKPDNIHIAGKTGTNAYDKETINKYKLPQNADRDIWFSGYSPDYTISIWAGFDKIIPNGKTYFYSNDSRKKIPKLLFKDLMGFICEKNKEFKIDDSLEKVSLVKHLDGDYLPNFYVPSSFISYSYIKKDSLVSPLPELELSNIEEVKVFILEDTILISVVTPIKEDTIYETFYGSKGYKIVIDYQDHIEEFFTQDSIFEIPKKEMTPISISISESFEKNQDLCGNAYLISL